MSLPIHSTSTSLIHSSQSLTVVIGDRDAKRGEALAAELERYVLLSPVAYGVGLMCRDAVRSLSSAMSPAGRTRFGSSRRQRRRRHPGRSSSLLRTQESPARMTSSLSTVRSKPQCPVEPTPGSSHADVPVHPAADGPKKPDLSIIQVNLHGTLYTTKLAHHYFTLQNGTEPGPHQEDSCLILVGSGAAFLDCPRTPQYCSTKWGNRGIMHALRRTAYFNGSRVNVISPW
jgi:NAD(P)-dependent dehydrogenase (short-subunit alcohol dehydrogenase family)